MINLVKGVTPERLIVLGLPMPEEIWLTAVTPEFAAEPELLEKVKVRLPNAYFELATDIEGYNRSAHAKWENPSSWSTDLGEETYGIAGSVTLLPLKESLNCALPFDSGDSLQWAGMTFGIQSLAPRWKHAVGFSLETEPGVRVLFSGDFVDSGGKLCDFHGFARNYNGPDFTQIGRRVRKTLNSGYHSLFTTRGFILSNPQQKLSRLLKDVETFVSCVAPASPVSKPAPTTLGRFVDHGEGVFQMTNGGNFIVLIRPNGEALAIDPGPCDFENPTRVPDFLADLKILESQAGLKQIDLVLVTHIHGDHYDLWPVLKSRYPKSRLAAWNPVAEVIEKPGDYPYPCLLPWYDLGWTKCEVDVRLSHREPYEWNGFSIRSIPLPGHCLVHAAYLLQWGSRLIALTGDTVQTNGETDRLALNFQNHHIPGTLAGHDASYREVLKFPVDLNLGGHSSYFTDCEKVYRASLEQIERQISLLYLLACAEAWEQACVPKHFPKWNITLSNTSI